MFSAPSCCGASRTVDAANPDGRRRLQTDASFLNDASLLNYASLLNDASVLFRALFKSFRNSSGVELFGSIALASEMLLCLKPQVVISVLTNSWHIASVERSNPAVIRFYSNYFQKRADALWRIRYVAYVCFTLNPRVRRLVRRRTTRKAVPLTWWHGCTPVT